MLLRIKRNKLKCIPRIYIRQDDIFFTLTLSRHYTRIAIKLENSSFGHQLIITG